MRTTDALFVIGRALVGGFFVAAGLNHLTQPAPLVAAASAQGVPFPEVAIYATGALLLLGGASVITGFFPRVGVAMLALFLVGVTPTMHAFWSIADDGLRNLQLAFFLRNVALLGAVAVLASLPTPWIWSIDRAIERRHGAPAKARRGTY